MHRVAYPGIRRRLSHPDACSCSSGVWPAGGREREGGGPCPRPRPARVPSRLGGTAGAPAPAPSLPLLSPALGEGEGRGGGGEGEGRVPRRGARPQSPQSRTLLLSLRRPLFSPAARSCRAGWARGVAARPAALVQAADAAAAPPPTPRPTAQITRAASHGSGRIRGGAAALPVGGGCGPHARWSPVVGAARGGQGRRGGGAPFIAVVSGQEVEGGELTHS